MRPASAGRASSTYTLRATVSSQSVWTDADDNAGAIKVSALTDAGTTKGGREVTTEQQVAVRVTEVSSGGGRVLQVYDAGPADSGTADHGARLPVFWLHGTPMIGPPPTPLFQAATNHGLRWVSYDRPGYGGSSRMPDRDVASGAAEVALIADALGFDRFGVLGQSGGGPYALACAALLPDRVIGAVSMSGRAPYPADGLDWLAGMRPGSAAELQAMLAGREALVALLESEDDFDAEMFTPADHVALAGDWKWIGTVVNPALEQGTDGLIDDALAAVRPWGFDPAGITTPVLLVHGTADRVMPCSHSEWLARRIGGAAELVLVQDAGHISVFLTASEALAWLAKVARQAGLS
jgi:pimeloyl-ACP methyl ester carboxylesterase